MERQRGTFDDRQLDVLLDRLDGIRAELQTLNRRLDSQESLHRIAGELSRLNESLEALAYAALGATAAGRRRGTGADVRSLRPAAASGRL